MVCKQARIRVSESHIDPPLSLPSGHYFFVSQALLISGSFLWASAPKPITLPGTPFIPVLHSWIRDEVLAPNWLRVGTDIAGGTPTFNHAFALTGPDNILFGNAFD